MDRLTSTELANWTALYAATGLCCAMAVVLSTMVLVARIHRERTWRGATSVRAAILLVPRTWWRWQRLYLLSTPVTLGIVLLFARSLVWH